MLGMYLLARIFGPMGGAVIGSFADAADGILCYDAVLPHRCGSVANISAHFLRIAEGEHRTCYSEPAPSPAI
jgi:hypothetical protein